MENEIFYEAIVGAILIAVILLSLKKGWLKHRGFLFGLSNPPKKEILFVSFAVFLAIGLLCIGFFASFSSALVIGCGILAVAAVKIASGLIYNK